MLRSTISGGLAVLVVAQLSTAERVGPPQNDVVIDVMAGDVVFTNVNATLETKHLAP